MRSLLRWTAVLALVSLAATKNAAGLCLPPNSTWPSEIWLVGSSGGVPDAGFGQFVVIPRDPALNPCSRASVVVDLSGCQDLEICVDQLDPDAHVNCGPKMIQKIADAAGRVTFTVLGHSNGTGNATTLQNGARIFANGILLAAPTASTFDLDGTSGVGAGDLSAWLADFGSGQAFGRSDYDGNGGIDANDLSLWLQVFGAGSSATSCASSCP